MSSTVSCIPNFHHQQIMSSSLSHQWWFGKPSHVYQRFFSSSSNPSSQTLVGDTPWSCVVGCSFCAENHTAPRSSTITTTTWNLKKCYIMSQCHNYTQNVSEQVGEDSVWSSIHQCDCPSFVILLGAVLHVEQSDDDFNILQLFRGSKIKCKFHQISRYPENLLYIMAILKTSINTICIQLS